VAILHGEPQLISVLLAAFIVGIATGCLLCSKLSGNQVEPGIIPLGALGLSAFSIDLYLTASHYETTLALLAPIPAMQFISLWAGLHILLDLVCIGLFGGFFIVPLYAMVQARTDSRRRARVIAANNIMNAVFMISGSLLGMACLTLLGLTIPEFFLFMGLLNAAVLTWIFYRAPEFIQRFISWLTTNMTWLRKKRL
jgi:predicted MFS family arabinose efflux permease